MQSFVILGGGRGQDRQARGSAVQGLNLLNPLQMEVQLRAKYWHLEDQRQM